MTGKAPILTITEERGLSRPIKAQLNGRIMPDKLFRQLILEQSYI